MDEQAPSSTRQDPEQTVLDALQRIDDAVELITVERPAAERLTIYIDSPDGVDLALCERVSAQLDELRERYAIEVSSPGADRPLTRPEHFRRFLGHLARVRTSEPIGGRRNFTGTIERATDEELSLDADGEQVTIPYAGVARSKLVPDFEADHQEVNR